MPIDFSLDTTTRAHQTGHDLPARRQTGVSRIDPGMGGAATGGKRLEPMQEAATKLYRNVGGIESDLRRLGALTLAGRCRRNEDWDPIVLCRGMLSAEIDFEKVRARRAAITSTDERKRHD